MKPNLKFTAFVILSWMVVFISCKKEKSCERCRETNKPPIAIAGLDQVITLPTDSVSLDGRTSSDPDGIISEWLWTKISGPASFNIIKPTDSLTKVKALVTGTYLFELKVTGKGGLSAKDTVQVIVNDSPINQLPIANAGTDQTITLPLDSTWLDGSGSSPNGWSASTAATYVWTKISGPSQFLLSPATLQQTLQLPGYVPTTAIAKNLIPGTYLFRLQVTNSSGASDADTVQVIVVDDPLNPNTVTFRDLVWEQGDVYGLAEVDIFLTTSIRPDLFYGINAYRPVQVYLNLDSSASWILVPHGGNNIYTYDEVPLLLWIICYPNNPLLVGRKSSLKIKFL